MEGENNYTDLRTASFSVYLNSAQESFVQKLGESTRISSPPIPLREETHVPKGLGKATAREGEIGVFGAEKYFNMDIGEDSVPPVADDYTRKIVYNKDSHLDPYSRSLKTRSVTPSLSSETSSNSQTTFLRSFQRIPYQGKQNSSNGRSFLAGLSCNKSCSDRKSINVSKNKLAAERQMKEEIRTKVEEEPRISLEVFGSHAKKKGDAVAMNLERKLSILTWDAIPKAQSFPTSSKRSEANDDMNSEASSDLFEIENLSGTSSVPPLFTRQVSDGFSGCMTPTTLYTPSEASIEWSVVTASAADFSVVSDYEEKEVSLSSGFQDASQVKTANGKLTQEKSSTEKQGPKPRLSGGGLLGCTSHKAVNVAETAHKTNDKPKIPRPHPTSDATMPARKIAS
ncbi:hypothetical protein EUGRSUZ_B00480 [Eucalyptus grandis]|uniref:Uncharacterized protein n=2 Tax=Eucalyptus grandis TaxID=71139 RepID=A0ACC3LMU9_EUCGR|nr:hypothetical protein EUGRSUZ_B00480 [Eucalyptus grandis]